MRLSEILVRVIFQERAIECLKDLYGIIYILDLYEVDPIRVEVTAGQKSRIGYSLIASFLFVIHRLLLFTHSCSGTRGQFSGHVCHWAIHLSVHW